MNPHEVDLDKKSLAVERTDWAQHRTLLAAERTFSAWLRTGLASMAAGIAIARLLGQLGWPQMTSSLGAILILVSALIYVIAFWRYRQVYKEFKQEKMKVTPLWISFALILGLLVSDVMAMILVFRRV